MQLDTPTPRRLPGIRHRMARQGVIHFRQAGLRGGWSGGQLTGEIALEQERGRIRDEGGGHRHLPGGLQVTWCHRRQRSVHDNIVCILHALHGYIVELGPLRPQFGQVEAIQGRQAA